jgi:hypothetical protein
METFLEFIKEKFKSSPVGWVVSLLTVIFGILGLVGLFSDLGFSQEVTNYRYYILPLTFSTATVIVFVWFTRDLIYENERLKKRVKVLEDKENSLQASQQVILNLLEEVTAGRKFQITKVQFYNNVIYLILSKKRTQNLTIGDEIKVLDTNDGSLMGTFEICENNPTEFRAKVSDYISPLWEGFIRQPGNAESSALPNAMAILFK